jgi:hypothetical protein
MLLRAVALALSLLGLSLDAAIAAGSVSQVRMGMGSGRDGFRRFAALIQQYNASGEEFRIDTHCQSACTMFLSIRNVCVVPSARLLFHAGHTLGPNRQINPVATNRMMSSYNGALQSYLRSGGYMDTLAFHTISGRDIISKFGYRACK